MLNVIRRFQHQKIPLPACLLVCFLWMELCNSLICSAPDALKSRLKATGSKLPYYISLKLWTGLEETRKFVGCSIFLPGDHSFAIFSDPLTKEEVINSMQNIKGHIEMTKLIHRSVSAEPLRLLSDKTNSGAKGNDVLDQGTLDTPAYANTLFNQRLYVWKSEKGKLLANGAQVILREALDGNCVLLVTESFPIARKHYFFFRSMGLWKKEWETRAENRAIAGPSIILP